MSAKKLFLSGLIAVMALAATPNRASADWLFTPYFGGVFGGRVNFGNLNNFDDELKERATFGASLGWMGAGIIGAEFDFGFTPNFFENTVGSGDELGDSNVTTLMGNLILGVPIGGQHGLGVRPYASGGLGLIRSRVDGGSSFFDDLDTNDFGFNVGAGIHGFFTDSIGIRGDVRYFRSLEDNEPDDEFDLALADFSFWRATVGLTIRFGN